MRKGCSYLSRRPDIVPTRSIFLRMYEERTRSFLYTSFCFLAHAAPKSNNAIVRLKLKIQYKLKDRSEQVNGIALVVINI